MFALLPAVLLALAWLRVSNQDHEVTLDVFLCVSAFSMKIHMCVSCGISDLEPLDIPFLHFETSLQQEKDRSARPPKGSGVLLRPVPTAHK